MRRSPVVTALVAIVVAGACGSTVQLKGGSQTVSGGLSASDPGLGAPAAQAGSAGAPSADAGVVAAGPGGATAANAPVQGGGGSRTNTVVAGAPGPGVTDKTINVGFTYADNRDAAQAALGNTASTTGDTHYIAQTVINDINAHGGAAGRKFNPIWYPLDAGSPDTNDVASQKACAHFTQDNKTFVAFVTALNVYLECVKKSGMVSVTFSLVSGDDGKYTQYPRYYDVSAIDTNSFIRNMIDALVAQNYFSPWDTKNGAPGSAPVKLGLLIPDTPGWDAVLKAVYLPALAATGHPVDPNDVQRWHLPESAAGNSQAVSQISSAVLRFRSDGVTHVLPTDDNGLAFFSGAAEPQQFRPRYGVSTANAAQVFAGSLVPYAQLNGAVGFGWNPSEDLPVTTDFDKTGLAGPGRKHCLAVLQAAGVTYADANAKTAALLICDMFYSIRDSINAIPAGTPINGTTFMKGLESLGSNYSVAALPRVRYGSGKHWGATQGWHYEYVTACKCFHYVGAPYPLR